MVNKRYHRNSPRYVYERKGDYDFGPWHEIHPADLGPIPKPSFVEVVWRRTRHRETVLPNVRRLRGPVTWLSN